MKAPEKFIPKIAFSLLILCLAIAIIIWLRPAKLQEVTTGPSAATPPSLTTNEDISSQATSPSNTPQAEEEIEDGTVYLVGDPIDDWHNLQEALRESTDPNELIIAALYAQGSGAMGKRDLNLAETLLLRAYELDPENILVNFQIHSFCISQENYSVCGLPYVNNMVRLGANNANVMMQVATYYYNNGDTANAYLAMKQASTSDTSSAFEVNYIELVDKVLTTFNNDNSRDLQDYAFYLGVVAALSLPEIQQNNHMCEERIQSQVSGWRELCSQVGLRFAELDKSELHQYFGYKMYLQYSGYDEGEVRKHLDMQLEPSIERGRAIQNKDCYDENLNPAIPDIVWQEFVRLYREESENAATVFLFDALYPC